MKFVVPFTIPSTRWTFVTTSDSRSTLITGIAAHTLASNRSWTPAPDAAAKSSAPRRATSCLLAVTTCLPPRSSSSTYSPVGATPPMTSATTAIDGSPSTSAMSVVSTPSSGGNSRGLSALRTSAFTTRSRWPVARSMSSACSLSRRLTAAPTVPYPSRATGTSTEAPSTDAMCLGQLAALQAAERLADLFDLRLGELLPVLDEARGAAVHLGDPLAREAPVLDRAQHLAHVLAHVVVDDPRADGVRAVLGGVTDRVVHPLDAALVDEVDDELDLVQALVVGELGRVAGLDERL